VKLSVDTYDPGTCYADLARHETRGEKTEQRAVAYARRRGCAWVEFHCERDGTHALVGRALRVTAAGDVS